ncbi:MAG: hypothetical protein ABJZ55_23430 [Fuerstiella sp.]
MRRVSVTFGAWLEKGESFSGRHYGQVVAASRHGDVEEGWRIPWVTFCFVAWEIVLFISDREKLF